MPDREDVEISRTMYALGDMNATDIYKALCQELKFNTMIKLYNLLHYKMTWYEDSPELHELVSCASEDE